jgi:hypothetical protein
VSQAPNRRCRQIRRHDCELVTHVPVSVTRIVVLIACAAVRCTWPPGVAFPAHHRSARARRYATADDRREPACWIHHHQLRLARNLRPATMKGGVEHQTSSDQIAPRHHKATRATLVATGSLGCRAIGAWWVGGDCEVASPHWPRAEWRRVARRKSRWRPAATRGSRHSD